MEGSDLKTVRLPFRSPNLNARAERFVRSIKKKCLDRIMLYGKRTLRHTVKNFVEHYHSERNPQGLGNRIIESDEWVGGAEGQVSCRERLGGLLKHYHRRAA